MSLARTRTAWPLLVLLLMVVGGLPVRSVLAQGQGGIAPAPNAFDLSIGLGGRLTSNAGLGSSAGESTGDSIADLRADLVGHRSSRRTDWSVRYNPFYTRYDRHGEFNALNHALNFDGHYLLTRRSRVVLLQRFFYSRNPLQIGVEDIGGEAVILTRQTKRWRSFSDAAFDSDLSRSVTLHAGSSARFERFDLDTLVDTDMTSGRLGIEKKVGRRDGISSTYTYSRFGFGQQGSADAVAHGLDVAWSHGAPARTEWTLSAGISRVARADDRQNRFTAGASLHHPWRRVDFVSGYNRSLGTDAAVANVTVAQNAYAALSARIGRRASLGVRGEYGTRDSVLGSGDRLSLNYVGGALYGDFPFNPDLSLATELRRRRQDVARGTSENLTIDTLYLGLVFHAF
jgi:hypothetical protein